MPKDVIWVNDTLGINAVENFIKTYLEKYPEIRKSKTPDPPRRREPGPYFINFIETCRKNLLSNPHYYHYNNKTCNPMKGPNLVYSLLLKHIVHNAKKYTKSESDKIQELLFWFEQEAITQLVVIPLDKYCKKTFKTHRVLPRYTGQEDGTLGYCSRFGVPNETGGMEISNTRVHELLKKIHAYGDDGEDGDGEDSDGGEGDDGAGGVAGAGEGGLAGAGEGGLAGAGEGGLAGAGGKKRQIRKSRIASRRRRHPSTKRNTRRTRRRTTRRRR